MVAVSKNPSCARSRYTEGSLQENLNPKHKKQETIQISMFSQIPFGAMPLIQCIHSPNPETLSVNDGGERKSKPDPKRCFQDPATSNRFLWDAQPKSSRRSKPETIYLQCPL